MAEEVMLLSVGGRTPVGLNGQSSAASVRAGICAIEEHQYFVDGAGEKITLASDSDLPPDLRGTERLVALAAAAMAEAFAPVIDRKLGSVRVFAGAPEPRPGCDQLALSDLAEALDRVNATAGIETSTVVLPHGHAAGLMALEMGCKAVGSGQSDLCLVGGVDSYVDAETLEWLDDNRQLMSARNRSGFPPGEGSGFCLISSSSVAKELGVRPLARITDVATTLEKNVLKGTEVCIGEGLSAAFTAVTKRLQLPEQRIGTIYCDMNGERYRVEEYTFTALRHSAAFISVHDTVHPADCWGDVGASSGPLYACLAVASGQRGYARNPRVLLFTGSEGGYRSAAVLELLGIASRE